MIESASVAGKRVNIRAYIFNILLWVLLLGLLITGFSLANTIKRYPTVSLRYNTSISGKAAYSARQYSISHSDSNQFWPTFWHEYKASLESEFVTANTACIAFSGEASLVWPADYTAGVAPGVIDGGGCAISEALAWRLWGSTDVTGMTVKIDGTARTVRGVFKGESELALVSVTDEDTGTNWSAVELTGGPKDAVRADAQSYATSSGLGNPDFILMGVHTTFAGAMSILPIIIMIIYILVYLIRYLGKRYPASRTLILFAGIFAVAIALPFLLDLLPAWFLPTRWSDFSFWSSLSNQISNNLKEFLSVVPHLRDTELRMLLLKQAGVGALAVCCSIAVCFSWHILNKHGGHNG